MSNTNTHTSIAARVRKIRLGDMLLSAEVITAAQLDDALAHQKKTGHKLGRALTEIGALPELELHRFLAQHLNIEYIDLGGVQLDQPTVGLLSEVHARRHRALVLQQTRDDVLVGMADPTDIFAYDEICRLLPKPVRLVLVGENDLLRTLDVVYRRTDEINALAAEVKRDLAEGQIDIDRLTADDDAVEAPVTKAAAVDVQGCRAGQGIRYPHRA